MKAKPKCVALGFKLFGKRIKKEQFTPFFDTVYSPFKITIDGHLMKFIVNPIR